MRLSDRGSDSIRTMPKTIHTTAQASRHLHDSIDYKEYVTKSNVLMITNSYLQPLNLEQSWFKCTQLRVSAAIWFNLEQLSLIHI